MLSREAHLGEKFIKKFKEKLIIEVREMIAFWKKEFIIGSGQMDRLQAKFYFLT